MENRVITKGTQKQLVKYISRKYGISQNAINEKIRTGRKCGFIWDGFNLENVKIIFSLDKGNMSVCEYVKE